MHFEGTIIITDPCYLKNNMLDDDLEFVSDNMMERDTIYGDWGCTTYVVNDVDEFFSKYGTNCKKIGKFSADSGRVCVCYLNEILEFNPRFAKWALEHLCSVTIIPDFKGDVEFIVKKKDGSKYLHVVGKGNINFVTVQISL